MERGISQVCDFNLSKILGEGAVVSSASKAISNPRWLAPEVLAGVKHTFASVSEWLGEGAHHAHITSKPRNLDMRLFGWGVVHVHITGKPRNLGVRLLGAA